MDMQITVLTPDRELFSGRAASVKVPGVMGQFQVLKNHAPIVSALEKGVITLVTSPGTYRYYDIEHAAIKEDDAPGKVLEFEIESGFIEVLNNEVALLVQGAHRK